VENLGAPTAGRPTLDGMDPLDHPIRHLADLAAVWEHIDGGLGYSRPQLHCLHLDADGRLTPLYLQIDDTVPSEAPDDRYLEGLMRVHQDLLAEHAPGGSVAHLRARPGGQTLTALDRTWVRRLHAALQQAPFASYPVFFGSDAGVRIVPPDELVSAA